MQTNEVDARLKLILSAQTDSLDELEKVWMLGYDSGQKSASIKANPFPKDTIEHSYWAEGFEAGEFGEEPLFPEYISILSDIEGVDKQSSASVSLEQRKRFHLNKVDKLLATTGVSVATASMVAAALINFVA